MYPKPSLFLFCLLSLCSVTLSQTIINIGIQPGDPTQMPLRIRSSTTITLAAGTYFLPKPIQVSSGAHSVILQAQPGSHVVLSAGQFITDWKPATLNGHACWAAYLPAVRLSLWNFRELWVNGTRATRSRFPARGYFALTQPAADKSPWNEGQTWFGYKPGDLPDELPADAEAIVMNRWEESRLPIDSVDPANHRVNSTRKTVFHLQDGDPYYLEGGQQWFEHPGDWYLDHRTGNLYYLPRPGETPDNVKAIAPTRDRILEIKNATNVTLRGLTFSDTEWNFPDPMPGDSPVAGGFPQAAIGVSSAVILEHCRDCRFESCRFEHLGNYALELGKGCRQNTIDHCTFTDSGAGAIKIGETEIREATTDQTFANTVTDCRITDGGHIFPSACGIWLGQSYDNHIAHNELADLYYTAISLGWTWGYGPSLSKGNTIEKNLIHDIGQRSDGDGPILSDMGAIYTLGARAGTIISNNVIHDIAGRAYGGWGIYLDEGSSNVLIENNLVYRTTHGGFHLHYGKDNLVQNNIFAFARDIQIARTRDEKDLMFTFKHNIVYWNSGVFTATDPKSITFDQNLYRCFGDGKLTFAGSTFDQWKAAGQDLHSILADPGFANPGHGDFTVPPDSPAQQIHFQPLNIDGVGSR